MSVGLSWSSLAVLAWLRMAAVSSRRAIRLASAAFLASVTLFIRSFMSPGRITSRMPTEAISRPRLTRPAAQPLLELLRHGVLVREERVELAAADDGPQRELRFAVERLPHVVRLADGLTSRHDLVGHHGVEPQRDLVGRHDLLAADVEHRLAQVDLDHA